MRKALFISIFCLTLVSCKSSDKVEMNLQPLMEKHGITGIQAVLAEEKNLSNKFNESYFIYGEGIADTTVFQAALMITRSCAP